MVKNVIKLLLTTLALAFLTVGSVSASGECVSQYGGTVECPPTDLTINKKVQHPSQSGVFVENLTATDPAYSPTGEVLFQLTVRNGSNQTFSTVTVRDIFPKELDFEAGPGTYEKSTKTLTFTLENLKAGESRVVQVLAKVQPAGSFDPGRELFCDLVNTAKVTGPDGRSDDDNASLCVQTKVLGAVTLPAAGFNDLLVLLPFAALGLGGIALLKKRGS